MYLKTKKLQCSQKYLLINWNQNNLSSHMKAWGDGHRGQAAWGTAIHFLIQYCPDRP